MKKQVAQYKRVATNIARHRGGTYYLVAKINGDKVRRSLATKDLEVAKMKRNDLIGAIRGIEVGDEISTVGEALELVSKRLIEKPGLKSATVLYYTSLSDILKKELPLKLAGSQWTREAAREWWKKTAKKRSPTQANNLLQMLRKVAEAIRKAGLRGDLVTTGLMPVRVPLSAVNHLPSKATLVAVVANMRANVKNSRHRDESADMVEFLAWSGLRLGELNALEWKFVGDEWVTVVGGDEGTKNMLVRRIPINPPLAVIIARLRYPGATGKVFSIKNPKNALQRACKRVGIEPLRNHDLRHVFATVAIENGIDIPTVARWLGHKDNGVLAMKTYGHLRDEHSLASAKKMA